MKTKTSRDVDSNSNRCFASTRTHVSLCMQELRQFLVLDTDMEIDEHEDIVSQLYEAAEEGGSDSECSSMSSSEESSSSPKKKKSKGKKKANVGLLS